MSRPQQSKFLGLMLLVVMSTGLLPESVYAAEANNEASSLEPPGESGSGRQVGSVSRIQGQTTTTTLPPSKNSAPPANAPTKPNYAAVAYAKQKNVSMEVAARRLEELQALTKYADEQRGLPGYAGFKIIETPDGPRGQMAKTSLTNEDFDQDGKIQVFASSVAEADFLELSTTLTALAQESGIFDASAVTVDPFSGELTVWRQSTDRSAAPTSMALLEKDKAAVSAPYLREIFAKSDSRISPSAEVKVRIVPDNEPVRGGQKAVRNVDGLPECTTAFGMIWQGQGGYLTAGHCSGSSNWSINGNNVITYYDRIVGGYQDRVIMRANGASWLVQTGAGFEDMAAQPTHIYSGGYYCSYSRKQYGQRCDTVTSQNVPVNVFGQTVFVTEGGFNHKCVGGDSGGPVWQPGFTSASIPAGTIEAGNQGNADRCAFLALDDQMIGSGFTLL